LHLGIDILWGLKLVAIIARSVAGLRYIHADDRDGIFFLRSSIVAFVYRLRVDSRLLLDPSSGPLRKIMAPFVVRATQLMVEVARHCTLLGILVDLDSWSFQPDSDVRLAVRVRSVVSRVHGPIASSLGCLYSSYWIFRSLFMVGFSRLLADRPLFRSRAFMFVVSRSAIAV